MEDIFTVVIRTDKPYMVNRENKLLRAELYKNGELVEDVSKYEFIWYQIERYEYDESFYGQWKRGKGQTFLADPLVSQHKYEYIVEVQLKEN